MKDESCDYVCDYLVVGGGATGMAFADTLLKQHSATTNKNNNKNNNNGNDKNNDRPSVIVVDRHESPGGQWHDSYDFVRLHQPSNGYGVESKELAPHGESDASIHNKNHHHHHRATRSEILAYYDTVKTDLESNHGLEFLGGTTLDRSQLLDGDSSRQEYTITHGSTGRSRTIRVRKRLVDARNLEPDLPVSTLPKFSYDPETVDVLPVNDIASNSNSNSSQTASKKHKTASKKHFVVVGGGKTGMDAVHHLLTEKQISPENLLWVVPNDAWITAREKIGNCIDLLYESAKLHNDDASSKATPSSDDADEKKEASGTAVVAPKKIGADFFQKGFVAWEQRGHIYRLDPSMVPTKFKDATLSLEELGRLQTAVPRIVRKGRVSKITDRGTMVFVDGSKVELPFPVQDTLFVHCAAGAFHCSKSTPTPIFENHKIVVQDIYGTPGFCFVGSMIGKLESLPELSDDDRNAMARFPKPPPPSSNNNNTNPLGKSDGDVLGAVSGDHPYIQRARNLKAWIELGPGVRDWLFANRLFHLKGADPKTVLDKLEFVFGILRTNGIES